MKARAIKCPKCGKGFMDVSPEYELAPDSSDGYGWSQGTVYGHCAGGHQLKIETWPGDDGWVTSVVVMHGGARVI